MSDLQVSNVFTDGDTVSATNFNTNYSDIVTYINNRNSSAATWDAMYCTSTSNVPLTANNSTGIQDIARFQDNGTTVFSVNDGGYVNSPYQDFSYLRKSTFDIYGAGPVKISTWGIQSQTHSSMDTTGKFTVQASGKHVISATIDRVTLSGTELMTLYIYVNGAPVCKSIGPTSSPTSESWTITDILNLTAGDYVEIYGASASGFAVGDGKGTSFYVMKLS